MDSRTYWLRRQKKMLRALNETEDKLNARLKRLYEREAAEFTKDIAAYYAKYGRDNVIEYHSLLLSLDEIDRDKLYSDWEAFETQYPQYAHLGDVRKSIYKLNRLQGLQENVTLRGLRMGAFTEAEIRAHLESLADSTYTEAWEFLYGSKPVVLNKDLARRYVGIDWTGSGDFSSRIWADTDKLSKAVNMKLAIGFARGTKYDTLARALATEIVTKSVRNAYRVAYTEGTYIYNETNAGAFEDAGAKTYIFKTAQDSKVCDVCRDLDGKEFLFSERTPGYNFPPMHPFCRCVFQTSLEDDWYKQFEDTWRVNEKN